MSPFTTMCFFPFPVSCISEATSTLIQIQFYVLAFSPRSPKGMNLKTQSLRCLSKQRCSKTRRHLHRHRIHSELEELAKHQRFLSFPLSLDIHLHFYQSASSWEQSSVKMVPRGFFKVEWFKPCLRSSILLEHGRIRKTSPL